MSDVVKVLKLVSGEEVIGRWELDPSVSPRRHKMSKVRQVVMQPVGPQQVGIALIPWLAADQDGEVRIREDNLLCDPILAPENLEKEYLQQTTGIALAK